MIIILGLHSSMLAPLVLTLIMAFMFLAENLMLLIAVKNNNGDCVFKIIKIGSGTLAANNLLQGIIHVIIFISDPEKNRDSDIYLWNLIVGLVNVTFTGLGVLGIWKGNTKLFSAYIFYSYFQCLIFVYFKIRFILYVFALSAPLSIIVLSVLVIGFWKFYLIFFFVLHLNIINILATNETTDTGTSETIALQQL